MPLREQLKPGTVPDRAQVERSDLPPMPENPVMEPPADMGHPSAGDMGKLPDMNPHADVDGKPTGDQVPGRGLSPDEPAADGDGYLRLRVAVNRGRATVTTASRVDGPLVTTESATGGYLWEVTLDDEVIATDALGDLSTRRSFPDPDARPEDPRSGHHVTELTSFEFTVRVPMRRLPAEALGRAQIGLYRVKDATKPIPLRSTRRSLRDEFASELREVARVPSLDAVPEVAEGIRRALRR